MLLQNTGVCFNTKLMQHAGCHGDCDHLRLVFRGVFCSPTAMLGDHETFTFQKRPVLGMVQSSMWDISVQFGCDKLPWLWVPHCQCVVLSLSLNTIKYSSSSYYDVFLWWAWVGGPNRPVENYVLLISVILFWHYWYVRSGFLRFFNHYDQRVSPCNHFTTGVCWN